MSELPIVDDRHPADVVTEMVQRVLAIAGTWTGRDVGPVHVDDRTYTPHKAIRRVADHLIDHLAEIEARLTGTAPLPDRWHASATTTPADLAPFTTEDFDEAVSRLTRLGQIFDVRLRSLTGDQLDHRMPGAWTIREIAIHVSESTYYAEAVGARA